MLVSVFILITAFIAKKRITQKLKQIKTESFVTESSEVIVSLFSGSLIMNDIRVESYNSETQIAAGTLKIEGFRFIPFFLNKKFIAENVFLTNVEFLANCNFLFIMQPGFCLIS